MSKRTRRSYTTEFKLEAVRQVRESDKTAAQELGMSKNNILRRWYKEQDKLAAQPPSPETQDEELCRLRSEMANLKEDNEILKKVAAYFAMTSR